MGVRGLGTDSGVWISGGDYRNEGWCFPEDFGAWDCTLVIMFIRFSVLFVEARDQTEKKSLPLSFCKARIV